MIPLHHRHSGVPKMGPYLFWAAVGLYMWLLLFRAVGWL